MKNLCFKFICHFIYIYYVLVNICVVIIPSPCVLVRQSRVVLVDYVSPLWGLNNHVSPRGTWPEKHNPHVQIPSFSILLCCEYCYIFPLFLCDLGVIIPIGRGGICENSMRLYPPCNPIGVGPTKIIFWTPLFSSFTMLLWLLSIFPSLIWAWKHRTVLVVLGKSFK